MRKVQLLFKTHISSHTRRLASGKVVTVVEHEDKRAKAPSPMPETIVVDGVSRPTTNSAGKPIHPTEEGVRNFWKWFGDSKVVDDHGRPMVVYHGTQNDIGVFKLPAFFTEFADEASAYTFTQSLEARDKLLRKPQYKSESGLDLVGRKIPYAGAGFGEINKDDIVMMTDEGVAKRNADGTFTIYLDLKTSHDVDADGKVLVRRGDNRSGYRKRVIGRREFIDRRYPPGLGVGGNVLPVYLRIMNPLDLDPHKANRLGARLGATEEDWQNMSSDLERDGYDGIVTESDDLGFSLGYGENAPRQWLPLQEGSIKSAIGNTGDFSPTDNAITKSLPLAVRITRR